MMIRQSAQAVANARRTRLGAGWVPNHHAEPREYPVTAGPVANDRRAQVVDDEIGAPESC